MLSEETPMQQDDGVDMLPLELSLLLQPLYYVYQGLDLLQTRLEMLLCVSPLISSQNVQA